MMRSDPKVVAEVLLACIIDDSPREETGGTSLDWRLGLEFDHDDRPIIFWNSPFFPLLGAAPEHALAALMQLVDFCTERWAADQRAAEPQIALRFPDSSVRGFDGDWLVLDWSQSRRSTNSQLFSALDALERWIWLRREAGEDLSGLYAELLAGSHSAAILGVLANSAKHRPQELLGPLEILLTSPDLIILDEIRVRQRGFHSDWFAWHRAGERVWEIARPWLEAPHRSVTLKEIIRDLRRADCDFDARAARLFANWPEAPADKALRQRALLAELDPTNWTEKYRGDGEQAWEFRYPADIEANIKALQDDRPFEVSASGVLRQFEALLANPLTDEDVMGLYTTLTDGSELAHFDDADRRIIEVAIAALVIVRGNKASRDPIVLGQLEVTVGQCLCMAANGSKEDKIEADAALAWGCLAAVHAKARGVGSADTWDSILATGLATGDTGIIRTIISAARARREGLQGFWWHLVERAVWAAALDALRPRYDDEPELNDRIERWRQRLRRLPQRHDVGPESIDLVDIAERVERLWASRYRRQFGVVTKPFGHRGNRRRYSLGISTHVLVPIFDWALNQENDPGSEALREHRWILRKLWQFVEWRLRGDPDEDLDESDGFDRLDEFGFSVVRALAARVPSGTVLESRLLWEPVLALGPRGEFTVEHFVDCFFLRLYKDIEPGKFTANWEAMLGFVFAPGWLNGGRWYKGRSILRHVLGIDAASQIGQHPGVLKAVSQLRSYFHAFASEHIAHDHSTLAAFAYFIASTAGASLRMQAIEWIDQALGEDEGSLRSEASSALAELANVMLTEHDAALVAERSARKALLNVIGRLVRDQSPLALALQDRARSLR